MLPASTRLGPYEIRSPLGSGGMGEVYRARDTRLDRDVAIKVLSGPFAKDPQRVARFELEARAVASLAHPNILVLHDVGNAHDTPFVVTELLEGNTLRHHLQQAPLPWRRVAEIGIGVAEGLAAAHDKGIVHRDLKPENVFLGSDGRPKILDFGIARVTNDPEQSTAPASLTQTGALLGTVGYMAPEQVRCEVADARSDLFALGVVLHEAVTGRHPYARPSMVEMQIAVLHEDPPGLSGAGRPVPQGMERVVRRCLQKAREDRFQTAHDLAFALRAALADTDAVGPPPAPAPRGRTAAFVRRAAPASLLLLGVTFAAAAYFRSQDGTTVAQPAPSLPTPTIASIAVLPLRDTSNDPGARLVAAGIPRTIIRSLLELPDVTVRPYSSVAHYADTALLDLHEVGRQLDVEAVLAGTIGPHDRGQQITVELVDVRRNRSLWLQSYDLQQDPLFVQDDILQSVAARLRWRLSPAQHERLARRPTQDTAAYLEYLEGQHAVHQWTVADTKRGIDRLERALARDPGFALAHAQLADAYIAAAYIFMQPRIAFEKARQAATEALTLDPLLAEAHAAIATVQFHVDWDWDEAEQGFQQALRLNPRCAFAYDYLGWLQVARGRPDAAIAALEKAVELEPRSHLYNVDLAFVYQHARRFDAAEQQARRALELDRTSSMAPWALALVFAHRDKDYTAALAQAELFLERDRQRPDAYAMIGWLRGMTGELEAARAILTQLDRLPADVYVRAEVRAWICTGMGDKDAAFRHLEQVCDERSPGIVYIRLDPLFDRLRDDPRHGALLRRIGVTD